MDDAAKAEATLARDADRLAGSLAGLEFRYADPERNFDRRRVLGTVASLIKVRGARNTTRSTTDTH